MNDKEMADWDRKYAAAGIAAAKYAADNLLSLKKIKYFAAGSEETNCFVAEIHKNGKRYAAANNDGHGGNTCIDGYGEQLAPEVYALLERWADDTLDDYIRSKDRARIDKWIDKNVAKNRAAGLLSAVVRDNQSVSVVPTKLTTVEEFKASNEKYLGLQIEMRR